MGGTATNLILFIMDPYDLDLGYLLINELEEPRSTEHPIFRHRHHGASKGASMRATVPLTKMDEELAKEDGGGVWLHQRRCG